MFLGDGNAKYWYWKDSKNTSVFANITEAIQIIDKRQVLAIVYP